MAKKITYKQYREMVEEQAKGMLDALAFAATGDLHVEIEIPEGIDVLTDLAIGFSYLVDDLQALLVEQARTREELEQRVAERTRELEQALAEVRLVQQRYVHEQWQSYATQSYATKDLFSEPDEAWLPVMSEAVQSERTVHYGNGGNQTALAIPIRYSDELIGVLGFGDDDSGEWEEEDISAVEAVVEQVGLALENQRLFDQTQTALAETEALYRASAELSRTQTYEELLTTMRHHTLLGGQTPYVSLNYFDRPWTDLQQPKRVNVLARHSQLSTADMPTQYEMTHFILSDALLRRDAPTIIEDVANDSRLDKPLRLLLQQQFEAVSTLFVPLVVSGQWVGFIHAVYHKPAQFSDVEMRRLMALAGQAAVVAQTIRLLEETQNLLESEQRQRRIADKLVNATARMTGILDEQEICHILIDEINDLIRPDQISLYAWSEDDHCLRLDQRILASPDDAEDDYQLNQLITQDDRPDLWVVFQKNEPLLESARQTDEFIREHYCLPWLVGGQVAGIIEAYHTARFLAIRDVDQRAAEDMVRQADLRIQNARLFAQSRRRAEELAILNEMGRNLTVTQDVNEVVETIYTYANRLMDARNFYVALHHLENNNITFPLAREAGQEIELAARPFGQGATEYVIQSGRPLLIEDGVAKWLADHGFNPTQAVALSWLGVPLAIGNQIIGAIAVRSSAPSVYDINHQNLLTAISGQSAIAIQNARLFAQTQEQLADLTTIQEVTSGLTAATSLEGAVDVLLPQVIAAVQGDSARLFLVEGENGVRVGIYPPEQGEAVHLIMPLARHPVLQKAVETRQLVAVSVNDSELAEHTRQVLLATGLTAIAVTPLVGGEGIMGLLLVGSHEAEKVFDSDEMSLLQTLADQATIAFERVRLLEDAQRRARREQLLREITGRVRSSADIDTIMKTAVQEIGRALGRETFIRLARE